jgi:hypothetical protein
MKLLVSWKVPFRNSLLFVNICDRHSSADGVFQFKYPLPWLAACLMAIFFSLLAWTVRYAFRNESVCHDLLYAKMIICCNRMYLLFVFSSTVLEICKCNVLLTCIVMYPCNMTQKDALFFINLFQR